MIVSKKINNNGEEIGQCWKIEVGKIKFVKLSNY